MHAQYMIRRHDTKRSGAQCGANSNITMIANNKIMMIKRRQRRQRRHDVIKDNASSITMMIMLFKLVFIYLLTSSTTLLPPYLLIHAANEDLSSSSSSIDITNNGHSNLLEGQRLFRLGDYTTASTYLWRAVLLHSSSSISYEVNDAFTPFLQCYIHLNKLVDGITYIAAESYLRGQFDMGRLYLQQALESDAMHIGAKRLKDIVTEYDNENIGNNKSRFLESVSLLERIKEVRDAMDVATAAAASGASTNDNNDAKKNSSHQDGSSALKTKGLDISDLYSNNNDDDTLLSSPLAQKYQHSTPEEIYNIGTHYFNTKNLTHAEQLFQLSCIKSHTKLAVACTNAVYLRTNLCLWGVNGMGFERDMEVVRRVTRGEMEVYRSVREFGGMMTRSSSSGGSDDDDGNNDGNNNNIHKNNNMAIQKKMGISNLKANNDYILWNRATSVHPHMMLGYPFHNNDDAILKRYSSESMAILDELRARAEHHQHHHGGAGTNGRSSSIPELPDDLPYSVMEMRDKFVKKNNEVSSSSSSSSSSSTAPPIKVGFVASGFNSKAVLYLSHDLFRFFDPEIVEIHIFSTGQPDPPHFIESTMRGVDWRQRVIDTVDYFHDVRHYRGNHIGLARYIHDLEIQILIEWDGYARQGDRAGGLMALRPAPIQILHQEFLMTSGAQYVDYIITDKIVSPLELEGLYTEKFLWLPNHFFSKGHAMQKEVYPPQLEYIPKAEKESKFELGVGSPQENACLSSNPLGGDITDEEVSFVYCNFNKFLKHNPETMRSWIRILEQVPNSILCLLENPAEGIPNLRKFVMEEASSNDDNDTADLNDRIHFLPWEKNPFDHQRRSYSLCNAMLDSYPYNGHTTAQDALYAGVPLITRSDGDDMSSRVSTSANVVLGLEELNAYGGIEEYETIAIRMGADKGWFVSIRTKLIETCLQKNPMHPYWDVPRYVNNFQNGLKDVWSNFLAGNEIEHVEVKEEREQGTMDIEIAVKEEKRKKALDEREQRTRHRNDDEL